MTTRQQLRNLTGQTVTVTRLLQTEVTGRVVGTTLDTVDLDVDGTTTTVNLSRVMAVEVTR